MSLTKLNNNNNMNKTLTPAIVGAYWNTPIKTPDGLGMATALTDEKITVKLFSDGISTLLRSPGTYLLSDCQLAAKAMSEITDDDAKECGSICGLHTGGSRVERKVNSVYVYNDSYQLQIYFNGHICLRKNGAIYDQDMRRVYEYLRSKSYYCDSDDIALSPGRLPDYKDADPQKSEMKTQFKIWLVNYLVGPFSWSKWTDINTFEFHGDPYLLQGMVNKVSNAKKFRVTRIGTMFGASPMSMPFDKLRQHGLIEDQVKYNK
jgi:hypothetical protein